ncbi:cytidylyltransferase domain-containing protein [Pelagibius sp.]|uniref:acylneuraminate cytidylyltransferase family protein n=1 Tax=Pelagibius sp. TaxID=1931238 RepID=UPI003B5040D5
MTANATLGLIPAKGGSTRLAMKNVRLLGGKPLIAWAAEAARASGVIDHLILSTEDSTVAATARDLGIEVPFMRPPELARDPAGVVEVALHALDVLEDAGRSYDTLIIMLPTCPFRTGADIRGAYDLFVERDRPFLMSVAEYTHTPFAALRMTEESGLEPVFPEYLDRRSQTMPKAFRPNGAVHVLDVRRFRAAQNYFADPLVGYVMPRDRSIDIDTDSDLREAAFLLHEQTSLAQGAET